MVVNYHKKSSYVNLLSRDSSAALSDTVEVWVRRG